MSEEMSNDLQSLISNNGLRVKNRFPTGFSLTWDTADDNQNTIPATGVTDEPWYHVQIKKFSEDFWKDIYKGFKNQVEIKDLESDTTFYFRMRRNGVVGIWGSEIIVSTERFPELDDDLHTAVKSNKEEMVLRIIASSKEELKEMLLSLDTEGMTPLMHACQNGNYLLANTLIKVGAWVNAISSHTRKTALMFACIIGNVKLVELLDGLNANWKRKDNSGLTAFHHAINEGREKVIKYIVNRYGVRVIEEKDGWQWTPLLRAINVNCKIEIIAFLLEKGANPNAIDRLDLKSCLISAVEGGRRDIVEKLLHHGVKTSYRNTLGKTASEICKDSEINCMIRTKEESWGNRDYTRIELFNEFYQ